MSSNTVGALLTVSPIKLSRALYVLFLMPSFHKKADGISLVQSAHKTISSTNFFDDALKVSAMEMVNHFSWEADTLKYRGQGVLRIDAEKMYTLGTYESLVQFVEGLSLFRAADVDLVERSCERLKVLMALHMAMVFGWNVRGAITNNCNTELAECIGFGSHSSSDEASLKRYITALSSNFVKTIDPAKATASQIGSFVYYTLCDLTPSLVDDCFEIKGEHHTHTFSVEEFNSLGINF